MKRTCVKAKELPYSSPVKSRGLDNLTVGVALFGEGDLADVA